MQWKDSEIKHRRQLKRLNSDDEWTTYGVLVLTITVLLALGVGYAMG